MPARFMAKVIVDLVVTLFVALAGSAWARVIKSDDFEGYPPGDVDCSDMLAGGWDGCKEAPAVRYPDNSSDISIVASIPGHSGGMRMPESSKPMSMSGLASGI